MIRQTAKAMAVVLAFASTPALADTVTGSLQDGYGRLAFNLSGAANSKISATATGGVLAISFTDKTDIDPAKIVAALPRIITSGKADADGKTLRFVLTTPVKLHVSQIAGKAVVDLAPTDFAGKMPDLVAPVKAPPKPVDVASLPEIKLRTGGYEKFTRLVFDWPRDVSYQVFPGAGKMTVKFAAPIKVDVSAIARFAPAWVKNAAWRIDGQSTIVEFETDSDSGYHDFKDGTKVVLDVLAPKTDGAAYTPPGTAKPAITKMQAAATAPVKPSATSKQAEAIAQVAAQLSAKGRKAEPPAKPEAKPDPHAPAKPEAKPDAPHDGKFAQAEPQPDAKPATADTKTAEATPTVPVADGKRTPGGAVITFKGAGELPAAVFVRGLTAWVVLENAPSFDSRNLKTTLGDFAAGIEAASASGLGILRVTLKAPAEIGARADGNNLVVEIAATVAPAPITIGFARNQSDPRRTSLSTLLPAADHAFQVLDPAGGDVLTVVPAEAGRGVPAMRSFADFAALPSAAGLVITPFADDLSVTVNAARVVIGRPSGLALTPPQMPVAQSPSALARNGGGPTFLDFARWGQADAGSFLATQRKLTQAAAQSRNGMAPQFTLARFYLANGFAAEALGLINLMQAKDPALAGDVQLTTMKAAAEYMMGRYRDARNELIGPGFDSDRHAALWRGLTDAAMENWKEAQAHLDQASPVLSRYPTPWQARAILAQADAAMGLNRLDLADAALQRLPKQLEPKEAIAAELAQGRIQAAQNNYGNAVKHFAAVEKSGDDRMAAAAIFHRTNAALAAGAISQPQAIEQFEKLRFRWRGDALELKTLRKLASLYFGRNQWRDGLKTLRIAVQNFQGQEAARIAQDDMRNAFVKLFLNNGADKMKPVDALALFYDNLDLTPIGPDGDEMIRRMSDRLVAVDLLGPAANLLAYQVDKRLDGIAKAQVATRLAAIYLMDHKPEKAVATVRDSQITGLPDDEMHQRMILQARAFAALKQWDNALDLVAVDQAEDTKRLRADIYWEAGNWAVAGQKIEELLDARAAGPAPFGATERAEVLRAAVSYSLANDEASLARLRTNYAARMKGTPDANLFAVLSADIDQHGLAFREAAAKIASVDTLVTFMKDFTKRRSGAKS